MPDGVDATVQVMEAAEAHTMLDLIRGEADGVELSKREHAVLPPGQAGDPPLPGTRGDFG